MLEIVETAHRAGVKVRIAPKTTDLLLQRGEYVPGQGMPLFELRPPVLAGTDWVVKKAFDLVVSLIVVLVGLPLWLADRARDQSSTRAGRCSIATGGSGVGEREFGMLKFRTMVQGAAELQDELEGAERGAGRALQDPRRSRA